MLHRMDLPTCPSCQQSVLDDDAQECPFCGASMKGGASAPKSAPPKAAAPPRTAPKPPAGGAHGKSAPPAATPKPAAKESPQPEDDDPFAVDASVGAKAIAVSAQSGGGRTLEVTCPMCETTGYVSPKASGQMVKCCNPKCLVPIFQAPVIEKPAPPPGPPPKKPIPMALYAGIGAVALVAIAGLGYVFLGGSPRPQDGNTPLTPVGGTADAGTNLADSSTGKTADASADQAGKVSDDPAKIAAAREELLKKSLKGTVEAALNADSARKPYGRRLSAVAHAATGDIAGTQEQIDQLKKVGATAPHEAILPLVAMGWLQLPQKEAEFRKSIDEARALADQLPNRGRYAVEASIALAAGLCAAGKPEDARKVLGARQGTPAQNQLAAALQVAENSRHFNLDVKLPVRTFGLWQSPQATAVTLVLVSRGRWDDAAAWIKAVDAAARPECTIAYAESLADDALAAGRDADLDRAVALGNDQPPAVKSLLLARVAAACLARGNSAKTDEYLAQAVAALKAVPPPEPVRLDGVKAIMEYKAPDAVAVRHAALAAAEIAGVQAKHKQPEQAWESMQAALQFLRGSAPSFSLMKERTDQITSKPNAARDEVKAAFELKSNDAVLRQFAKYKPICATLFTEAASRFHWEVALLESAIEWGLLDPVMEEIVQTDAAENLNDNEPFLATGLPLLLAQKYEAAGNKEKQNAATSAAAARARAADAAAVAPPKSARALADGDVRAAVKVINDTIADTGVLHDWTLRLACRLVSAGQVKEGVQLIYGLKDQILKEDGLRLISALAARRGQGEALAKQVATMKLTPSELGNVHAGLAIGLAAGTPKAK